MKKCCSETSHRRLFTICWLVTSEHISETVSEPFNCSHCDIFFRKSHCNSIIMSEKRNRISLAQKLDIIEASKKSGFSIEDVMKKYGFFSLEKTDLVNLCGFFHAFQFTFYIKITATFLTYERFFSYVDLFMLCQYSIFHYILYSNSNVVQAREKGNRNKSEIRKFRFSRKFCGDQFFY